MVDGTAELHPYSPSPAALQPARTMNIALVNSLGFLALLLAAGGCTRDVRTETVAPAQLGTVVQPVVVERINRVTLASGLVIEDLKMGDGDVCLPGMRIRVAYTGWVVPDAAPSAGLGTQPGRLFDSSNGVRDINLAGNIIRAWKEGLPGMRAGGKRRLTIPPSLGYADREIKGASGGVVIPANSTLVYEVELMGGSEGVTK